MSKQCTTCKETKSIDLFPTCKSKGKVYHIGRCKDCERKRVRIAMGKTLNKKSPEEMKALRLQQRQWMLENKKKMSEHRQNYKEKNPQYYQERANKNQERLKEYRNLWLSREGNSKKIQDNRNKYHTESMVGNFMSRCNTRYKQCKKKYPNLVNMKDIKPFHFREIMERQNYICPLSGISLFLFCPVTEEVILSYNVDHIIPLSRGGTHELNNIQFLTPHANGNKSNTVT